jgi:DNA-nicking Smr family endonuclease
MSDEDEALWRIATTGVTPLGEKKGSKNGQKSAAGLPEELAEGSDLRDFAPFCASNAPDCGSLSQEEILEKKRENFVKTSHLPDENSLEKVQILKNEANCLSGYVHSMDQGLFKRLTRGEVPFTDRLDLHGYYEGDAWLATMDFLHEAFSQGHRCVLVICGKGRGWGAAGDMGVIKSQLAGWLATHPKVLAFHTASRRDGGTGAVYAYLRRNKTA